MRALLVAALISAFLLVIAGLPPAAAEEWNLQRTWVEPAEPVPGEDVFVYVELASVENVTWIRIIQCTITPYVCFSPFYVDRPAALLSSELLREVDPGTAVGWNVTVLYDNGTQEQSPLFGKTYPGLETISPVPEAIYFQYEMGDGLPDGEGDPLPGLELAAVAAAVLAVVLLVRWRRRRGGAR